MEKIRIYYDTKGNTLNVWFDDPKKEYVSEETGDEIILVKDRRGRVIGLEKLNYVRHPDERSKDLKSIPVEVLVS